MLNHEFQRFGHICFLFKFNKLHLILIILNYYFLEDINKQVDRNKQQRYQFYPGKQQISF